MDRKLKLIDYLKQPSTWKGIIRFGVSLLVINASPAVQELIVQDLLLLLGGAQGAIGLIDIFRDENKRAMVTITTFK